MKITKNQDGKRHSFNDQPAVIRDNGDREWWKDGQCHRDGDLPAVEWSDGSRWWFQNGVLHRDGDKPAMEELLHDSWYQNGKLHRDGGKPAVVNKDGRMRWYKNGREYFPESTPSDHGTKDSDVVSAGHSELDSVLETLYDHVFKGEGCDVNGLLRRYNELTGKDRPGFMS